MHALKSVLSQYPDKPWGSILCACQLQLLTLLIFQISTCFSPSSWPPPLSPILPFQAAHRLFTSTFVPLSPGGSTLSLDWGTGVITKD